MTGEVPERVYHYTSVESLALILRSKKVRFTRLDRVDDLREAQSHAGIPFGQYFFVSCWTCEPEESLPQWEMYSRDMQGVRIELPLYPFQDKPLDAPKDWVRVRSSGTLRAPLSLEEIFASNYFVSPLFLTRENFAGPVEYEEDIEGRYREAISRVEENGRAHVQIADLPRLARLKSREWAFQKEYRFSLFVTPSIPLPPAGPAASPSMDVEFGAFVANSVVNGLAPPINHIDVDLADAAIEDLVVRTGPRSEPGTRTVVEALLDKYAPHARVEESRLDGRIRRGK